jgi:CBS domain-containing protein
MVQPAGFDKIAICESLQATIPFSFLSEETLHKIVTTSKVKHYPRGSYIFKEGEKSHKTLYYILSGEAKALARISGEESITTVRNEGDYFGVTVLLSDEPYPISMVASKDLTCLLISQDLFQQAMCESDRFADYFSKSLAARLKELYKTFGATQKSEQPLEGQTLRQKVSDIQTRDVITALPMDQIKDVARKMSETGVSSVVIKAFNNKPVGIITEKDLVKKVLSAEKPDLERRAHEIMSSDLITVQPDDYTYLALLMMTKHNINHVVVIDEHDVLHGIVTIKDLIRTRNSGALSIVRQIERKEDFASLAEVIGEVDQVQHALLAERSYASEICALITELYDRITRKIIQLAEEDMIAAGWGPPPLRYCFINMGSAGRKEQFSRTDQDNGIIFADSSDDTGAAAADYFLSLGKRIVEGLEMCGFKRCPGKVMAENPRWCTSLATWKKNITLWVDKLDPDDIRNMTIFLDCRYLAGDQALYDNLKTFTTQLFKKSHHALLFMAEDDLKHRIPINMLGQFITEKTGKYRKKLNLKGAVMVHMVDCLRVFALREGIRETNSFERIRRLKEIGVFKTDDAEYIEAAYETLLMFRIRDSIEEVKQGLEPDHYIDPFKLSKKDRNILKESLLIVNRLQSLTAHAFHVHKA